MDGPQFDDQGLLNTDPRTIAVPESYVNNIPTDIRGVSFSRTPAMVRACFGVGSMGTVLMSGFACPSVVGTPASRCVQHVCCAHLWAVRHLSGAPPGTGSAAV